MPDPKPELKRSEKSNDGAYTFGDHPKDRRYTAYVRYQYKDDENNIADSFIEEIDVNAVNKEAATAVAETALEQDYEGGGVIVEVREQHGWYL